MDLRPCVWPCMCMCACVYMHVCRLTCLTNTVWRASTLIIHSTFIFLDTLKHLILSCGAKGVRPRGTVVPLLYIDPGHLCTHRSPYPCRGQLLLLQKTMNTRSSFHLMVNALTSAFFASWHLSGTECPKAPVVHILSSCKRAVGIPAFHRHKSWRTRCFPRFVACPIASLQCLAVMPQLERAEE